MAGFSSRPAENSDPWFDARDAYDQSLEDAINDVEEAKQDKLPNPTGQNGKVLGVSGGAFALVDPPTGTGTVTSVNGVEPEDGEVTLTPSDVGAQPAGSYAPAVHSHPASGISDSTSVGRAVLTAADEAAARTAIDAKAANWTPTVGDLPGAVPVDVFQASGGTWPNTFASATQRTNWIGYPGLSSPPEMTGRPAGVAGLDSYVMRESG